MNDLNKIHPMYQFSLKVAGLLTRHVSSLPSPVLVEMLLYTHSSCLSSFAHCVLCSLPFFYRVCGSLMCLCRVPCLSLFWPTSTERRQPEILFTITADSAGGGPSPVIPQHRIKSHLEVVCILVALWTKTFYCLCSVRESNEIKEIRPDRCCQVRQLLYVRLFLLFLLFYLFSLLPWHFSNDII